MPLDFPKAWSLLHCENGFLPYYYAMAYDPELLSYEFYLTDFTHVWREMASTASIVRKADALDYRLTQPQHVRETVGALNGCLFQQYGPDPLKQETYKSDITMRKVNPEAPGIDSEYTVTVKNESFRWHFDVKMMDPQSASGFLKYLTFSVFNMVHQLVDQKAALVSIIKEKDSVIGELRNAVDDLHGEAILGRYFGSEARQAQKFATFDYNSWAKNYKITNFVEPVEPKKDIWPIMDTVSRNEDIWEYSNCYYDSTLDAEDLADLTPEHAVVPERDSFFDEFEEKEEVPQEAMISPRKRKKITTDVFEGEEPNNIESLSQSFSENVGLECRGAPEQRSTGFVSSLQNPVQDIINIANSVKNRSALSSDSGTPEPSEPTEHKPHKKVVRSKRKKIKPETKQLKTRRVE